MRVHVPLSRSPYDVIIGEGVLDSCGEVIRNHVASKTCAILTDSNVGPLHAEKAEASLSAAGFSVKTITVPAGETSKALAVVEHVCNEMIDHRLDRSAMLVALGGGVVGDLGGFVASIYYRGIPYVQIPTTIVALVDSSVGGKTGVNAAGGKNLIGAFHQPRLVVADTKTLKTLPKREFNEGFAEVIKHAAIRDPEMLDLLDGANDLPSLVARNVAIKAAIVAEDEYETRGLRALLNFGHTIGHGIEVAAGYGTFLHGEAISLGLIAACRLSVHKSNLTQDAADRVTRALETFALPTKLPKELETARIIQALRKDKKFESGSIRFVLLRQLGEAFVSSDVTESDILWAIEGLR